MPGHRVYLIWQLIEQSVTLFSVVRYLKLTSYQQTSCSYKYIAVITVVLSMHEYLIWNHMVFTPRVRVRVYTSGHSKFVAGLAFML